MDYTPEQVAEDAYKIVLAATDGDEVIGTMQITDEGDGWQRFRAVAVSPMRQRQGIGRVLSAFGEDLVRAKGGHSVMLHARYMALRFYGSLGYAEVGPWFYEVGMPHKRMEKRLDR
jgi:GNAT superfamily N-acetyltransferase